MGQLTCDEDKAWYRLRVRMAINDVVDTGLRITAANVGKSDMKCTYCSRIQKMVIKGY